MTEKEKELERENQELKQTVINMSKLMFNRDEALTTVLKNIEIELRKIRKRER